ncbi:MAG: glycerophosphodiester phosphodiesterase [Planctomycetota bacterium]
MIDSAFRAIVLMTLLLFLQSSAQSQMIVAHRGASYDAPENTLAAFRLAWQQKSDGIEGDFYLTSDQKIVCIHDKTTKKTAGQTLVVEDSTFAQLRELEYGSWKDAKFRGEPIPTLEEVIETVPRGKKLVIELKSKQSIVPVLVKQLTEHAEKEIEFLIIAFDEATAAACKSRLPNVQVHWLTSFDDKVSPPTPTAAQIAATVKRIGVDGVGMQANTSIIDETFVETLRKGGCNEFHVWTVDSTEDAKRFQQLGAMGITTNIPAVIRDAIEDDAQ